MLRLSAPHGLNLPDAAPASRVARDGVRPVFEVTLANSRKACPLTGSGPAEIKFYLGTHMEYWLGPTERHPFESLPDGIPLFVSRNQLFGRKSLPVCTRRTWALDSGGFTELQQYGGWRTSPEKYAAEVRRFRDEIGGMDYAAPQDWMCEDSVINGGTFGRLHFVGTRLSVEEHQRLTVENFLELRSIAPDLPFFPVLQGYEQAEYLQCAEMYDKAGVDLSAESVVGVGSVCRRQGRKEIADLFEVLWGAGIPRLHGFGVKRDGIAQLAVTLARVRTARPTLGADLRMDSLVWSDEARRRPPLPDCVRHWGKAKNCANCALYATWWYRETMNRVNQGLEGTL